jgi:hypothetical protein
LPKIDRIVLYIDDLDRCPPELVVDVLQAVHLLLAYPLFVVVVGVDPRWLFSSLSRHHVALMPVDGSRRANGDTATDWSASPQNYLEKVFQIPFVLRSMEKPDYDRLVRDLLLPVDGAQDVRGAAEASRTESEELAGQGASSDLATEEHEPADDGPESALGYIDLTIEAHELEFVNRLWRLMPSPRAVKRLVNVYRLLRAQVRQADLPKFTGESPDEQAEEGEVHGEYQAVLLMLSVLIGAPDDARTVLQTIESSKHSSLRPVLDDLEEALPESSTPSLLREAADGLDAYPLEPFRAWSPRVRRYSFSFWELPEAETPGAVRTAPEVRGTT